MFSRPFRIHSAADVRSQRESSSWRKTGPSQQVLRFGAFLASVTSWSAPALVAGDTYGAWLSRHLTATQLLEPGLAAELAAPLGDGTPNLLKYALGLSPFEAPTPRLPRLEQTLTGPVWHLSLSGLQPLDVAIVPEVSTDLQTWRRGAAWARLETENLGESMVRRYVPGEEAERSLAVGENLHFRLRVERSGSLPPAWQEQWFGVTGIDPNADPDGDGRSNWQEYLEGTDPQNFYDGREVSLEIVSGAGQSGAPSTWLADALVVRVRQTSSGVPLPHAPVRFTPVAWGAVVGLDTSAQAADVPLVVRTDATGLARIRHRLPTLSVESQVRAAIELRGEEGAQVVLTATSFDPSTAPPVAPHLSILPPADGDPGSPLELSWSSPATNSEGFRLEIYDSIGHSFGVLQTFGATARGANVVSPAATSVFRLVAFNARGDSEASPLVDTRGRLLEEMDSDGDGLNDAYELLLGLDRTSSDSDGDGTPDGQDGGPLEANLQLPRPPERQGFAQIALDGFTVQSIGADGVLHGSRNGQPGFWRQGRFSPYAYPASWSAVSTTIRHVISDLDLVRPRVLVTLQYVYFINRPAGAAETVGPGPQHGPYPGGESTTMMATLLEDGSVEVVPDVLPATLHCSQAGFLSLGRRAFKVSRMVDGQTQWALEIYNDAGLLHTLNFEGLGGDLKLVGTDGVDAISGLEKVNQITRYVVWNATTGTRQILGPALVRPGIRDIFIGAGGFALGNAASGRASYWNAPVAALGLPLPQLAQPASLARPLRPTADTYQILEARPAEGRAILRKLSGSGAAVQLWQNSRPGQLKDLDPTVVDSPSKLGPGGLVSVTTSGGKLLVPAQLVPDWNRDGKIDHLDLGHATPQRPFRWWVNDDADAGDIAAGESDVPGAQERGLLPNGFDNLVNGLCDIVDFFPVHLDIAALLRVLPPAKFGYRLRQTQSALRFVYTALAPHELRQFLLENARSDYGPAENQPLHRATTQLITHQGTYLIPRFLNSVLVGRGVLLLEGNAATREPLLLEVTDAGTVIATISLPLRIAPVEHFYRWTNLRGSAGVVRSQPIGRPTTVGEPVDYPDDLTSAKNFVFVHGYSVRAEQARGWNAEIFKRLHQLGSKAKYHAITWAGDESKVFDRLRDLPCIGEAAPDYHLNVYNALRTAPNLAAVVNSLPGRTYLAAHSLGNMVASSAIKPGHNAILAYLPMRVERYFMIDAAVAMEAYDASLSGDLDLRNRSRHPDWAEYAPRLWSTAWHDLFPPGDHRRRLTWRGIFGSIPHAINFYSSSEEVLENANGTLPSLSPCSGERAWSNQEMQKGSDLIAAVATVSHGGWGFNPLYNVALPGGGTRRRTAAEAAALGDADLRSLPFFKIFDNFDLLQPGAGSAVAADDYLRYRLLATALPALTFATGANPAEVFGEGNIDLHEQKNGPWPRPSNRWFHSDFREVSLFHTQRFYQAMTIQGGLDQ